MQGLVRPCKDSGLYSEGNENHQKFATEEGLNIKNYLAAMPKTE